MPDNDRVSQLEANKRAQGDVGLMGAIVSRISELSRRVDDINTKPSVTVQIKTTTGDLATGYSGMIVVNTVDNTIKMYGDAGWRTLASGW